MDFGLEQVTAVIDAYLLAHWVERDVAGLPLARRP